MASCPQCESPLPEPGVLQCPSCGYALLAREPPTGPPIPDPGQAPRPPLAAAPFEAVAADGIPWDQRERIGLGSALVETTRQVLTGPTAFFRAMPVTGGLGSPLLYAVIVGWIGFAAAAFYQAVWGSIVGPGFAPFAPEAVGVPELVGWIGGWTAFVVEVLLGGIIVAAVVLLTSGVLHLMLLLLGGARRGFEATFRTVCFSEATSLLLLLPFCGLVIAGVWCIVACVIGLAEAHQIGYGKATAAALLPLVLVCCCCGSSIFVFAGALASLAGQLR